MGTKVIDGKAIALDSVHKMLLEELLRLVLPNTLIRLAHIDPFRLSKFYSLSRNSSPVNLEVLPIGEAQCRIVHLKSGHRRWFRKNAAKEPGLSRVGRLFVLTDWRDVLYWTKCYRALHSFQESIILIIPRKIQQWTNVSK